MPRLSALISSLAVTAVIGGLAYRVSCRDEIAAPTPNGRLQDNDMRPVARDRQRQNTTSSNPAPIAAETSEVDEPRPTGEMSPDTVGVHRILKSITLDENGRVVPDQTVKEALEQGFEELGPNQSTAAISELQKQIRAGLSGQAGEEAARILEDYYRFSLAQMEFNAQPVNQPPAEHYEKLVQLRRAYLGTETADELFAVEDTQGRHMMAAIAIQTNASLTDEEKQTQQSALQEKLNDRLLALRLIAPEEAAQARVQRLRERGASSADIYSTRKAVLGEQEAHELAVADREELTWQHRFDGFWEARRYVMQANLDDAERERQIGQLLDQYFSPEERERAQVSSFDRQAREAK